ncbi:MAG: hypothetical protein F4X82_02405 [Candidatus Spechtbacteria bacterium SB0662_bin_43]|uniref:Uncharacterized protein n=1 Tax=Candidatus Spechtbacteria bacterium SB0662_bin_43 TaxID=2604897 RepID=A0A845DA23_9BACT|nr:hypothetical protein [Candidatus Spechtbacteria bacterium SB0662_bin_43]
MEKHKDTETKITLRYILFLLFFLTSFVVSVFILSIVGIYDNVVGVVVFFVAFLSSYVLYRTCLIRGKV